MKSARENAEGGGAPSPATTLVRFKKWDKFDHARNKTNNTKKQTPSTTLLARFRSRVFVGFFGIATLGVFSCLSYATKFSGQTQANIWKIKWVKPWTLPASLNPPATAPEYRPTVGLWTSACWQCTMVASYHLQSSAESSASLRNSHPGVPHCPPLSSPSPSPKHWPALTIA